MYSVAPIKLQVGPKVLWFDPNGLDIHEGDSVIVTTKRGREFGIATSDILEVSDELIEELNSPLQPVERLATPEDEARVADLEIQGNEALVVFKEMVEETDIDMHPVMVEFLFDGDKAVFYFESEERVDFRELVRKLAAHFHVRVDMRQIGVRDGAAIIGGLGHCGQELCCKRLGGEFSPVTIRMAKEQNLSLNPQKISGACGRLMCCLRYEFEAYKEFNVRAPKLNAKVETPEGAMRVSEVNVPSEMITLTDEEGKTYRIPLAEFDEPEEGRRPHKVGKAAFERHANVSVLSSLETSTPSAVETVEFAEDVALAQRGKRSRKTDGTTLEQATAGRDENREPSRKRRRRKTNAVIAADNSTKDLAKVPPHELSRRRVRPGQKASGLAGNNDNVETIRERDEKQKERSTRSHRKVRTRSTERVERTDNTERKTDKRSSRGVQTQPSARRKSDRAKQRAPQKSSSPRQSQRQAQQLASQQPLQKSTAGTQTPKPVGDSHRKSRRRTHTTGTGKASHADE